MSYVDQKQGPSPAGMASALIVQGAIGALIVTGLSVATGVIKKREIVDTWEVRDPIPPEPEPMPEPETSQQPEVATEPPVTVPQPKFDFERPQPDYKTSEIIVDRPVIPIPQPTVEPAPPAPVPSFPPVSARPRNDPGTWLRDSDYRTGWVRREYAGVAGFKLDISATGKVIGCRLTKSTGHAELDQATCRLVQQRAKFEPARGPNGEPVAGSYSSAVSWVLPE
ncbi:TonB family protein [Qipengyuania sphaerica]|uniref:TonB family protein n=1 Tax=Qipengyuania sphaerica TaxID=2867243 RepID=UPI001C86727D|nr:TonB family protein [Qipengyuania sphaerica]MBX7541103.1 energy transducer TonB [Qipengyuania sphaerica]